MIPLCVATSSLMFTACQLVTMNTVRPVTGASGFVEVSFATVATPAAAMAFSRVCVDTPASVAACVPELEPGAAAGLPPWPMHADADRARHTIPAVRRTRI